MLTLDTIREMKQGDTITQEFVTIHRSADTKTGKPKYRVSARRETPFLVGGQGSFSPEGALRIAKWYLAGAPLKGDRR
jgi:hypothetical protein